jgi:uncharacterized membrane protein YfcA
MNAMNIVLLLLVGLLGGIFSGLIGIGGGIVLVPALVLLLGLSQHTAQGTTLAAMVPPIGLLAAWTYYSKGYVDLKIAGLICLGFFIGGLFGAKFAVGIPEPILKKVFGAVLLLVSLKMILGK